MYPKAQWRKSLGFSFAVCAAVAYADIEACARIRFGRYG